VIWLLDVNVLIALIDPTHVMHDAAHRWFQGANGAARATCPITENAVLRIVAHPKYPHSAGSPAAVAPIVAGLGALPGHVFWGDDLSLVASDLVDPALVQTPEQMTDTYLLALAVSKGGRLVTFDRRLSTRAVKGGRAGLHVIQTPTPAAHQATTR
jgi:toxin-antitoxin system PIN domain toxin